MANDITPTPRVSDSVVIEFFEKLAKDFGFVACTVHVKGSDTQLNWGTAEVLELKKLDGFQVQRAGSTKNNCSIEFRRNVAPERYASPDQIAFNNNTNNGVQPVEVIKINTLMTEQFGLAALQNPDLQKDPQAFAAVIASHQQMIAELERTLSKIAKAMADERLHLQKEQKDFVQKKEEELAATESKIREANDMRAEALAQREKTLDDRDNMHARRSIRAELKKRLNEHATNFTLTPQTQRLRWPIHGSVLLALVALVASIVYYTSQFDVLNSAITNSILNPGTHAQAAIPSTLLYSLIAKVTVLSVASIGLVAWYIRWMNRWFDQHANAEFSLKQFELDVDRASWVVETAMEWRASQHGVIPSHLLQSISNNLFVRTENRGDENIHAGDYVASAIFGSAARAKLKIGDNEIELDRKSLKNLKEN